MVARSRWTSPYCHREPSSWTDNITNYWHQGLQHRAYKNDSMVLESLLILFIVGSWKCLVISSLTCFHLRTIAPSTTLCGLFGCPKTPKFPWGCHSKPSFALLTTQSGSLTWAWSSTTQCRVCEIAVCFEGLACVSTFQKGTIRISRVEKSIPYVVCTVWLVACSVVLTNTVGKWSFHPAVSHWGVHGCSIDLF